MEIKWGMGSNVETVRVRILVDGLRHEVVIPKSREREFKSDVLKAGGEIVTDHKFLSGYRKREKKNNGN
jgi:hypothetical protein